MKKIIIGETRKPIKFKFLVKPKQLLSCIMYTLYYLRLEDELYLAHGQEIRFFLNCFLLKVNQKRFSSILI